MARIVCATIVNRDVVVDSEGLKELQVLIVPVIWVAGGVYELGVRVGFQDLVIYQVEGLVQSCLPSSQITYGRGARDTRGIAKEIFAPGPP
eukprot:CAMPEP_0181489854 /NCGR_PEP_ID=MMETSP1110-20121109/49227_1 /TAXON_ID=174948 /ORGANISM="Symbiodinium sp., Strain CCMP421" /LENGTH=90 /DNA_ID=CAMNT_0023616761 /DNA_START=408 /DNA_END=680 /DNA_ORIENTATION=-